MSAAAAKCFAAAGASSKNRRAIQPDRNAASKRAEAALGEAPAHRS